MAREASRKASCQNNLRQIGIGVMNYASSHERLPLAMGGTGYSFLFAILPYMDQTPLFNAVNAYFDASSLTPANSTAGGSAISLWLCPSDSVAVPEGAGLPWTGYAGSRGIGLQKYGEDGVFQFPPGTATSLQQVTDGTSTTAMASEWLLGSGPFDDRDPLRAIFQTSTRLDRPGQFEQFVALCHSLDVMTAKVNGHRKGLNWMHGEFGKTLYNHTMPLNDHTCLNGTGYQIGAWTAGSQHPGGANLLFADGNVRFMKDATAIQVWRAIGSRNGGEVVSADGF